jgi:hypothetical protein
MRTNGRLQRVSSTQHDTSSLDRIETFKNDGNDGARGHVLDQSREEGLVSKIGIVCQYIGASR